MTMEVNYTKAKNETFICSNKSLKVFVLNLA